MEGEAVGGGGGREVHIVARVSNVHCNTSKVNSSLEKEQERERENG